MTVNIKLCKPITAYGEQVTELSFREPCARDLKDFRIGDQTVGNFIPIIAALAEVPPSSIEAMHPADLFSAVEAIGPLLLPSPPTGGTS